MFTKQQVQIISQHISEKIISINTVSGGDIADSYLLTTDSGYAFLKTHKNFDLLEAEKIGMQTIARTNTIKTPDVLGFGKLENITFLALEWIDSKSPTSKEFAKLGNQLAELHKCTTNSFGFDSNNFIGSLHQSNTSKDNWNDFYVEERLISQLELASQNGLLNQSEIPDVDHMKSVCFEYFKNIKRKPLNSILYLCQFLDDLPVFV